MCPQQRLSGCDYGRVIHGERGWTTLEAKSFRICYGRISHLESVMCEEFLLKLLIPREAMGEGSAIQHVRILERGYRINAPSQCPIWR